MKFSIKTIVFVLFVSSPLFVFAAVGYTPLSAIKMPDGKPLYSPNFFEYLKNIYTFAIAVAGGLAVIKIIYGGVLYMLSDVVTNKADAKKEIWAAVVGLLLALGSATLLYTIDPNLLRLKFNIESTKPIVGDGGELIGSEYNEASVPFVGPPAPGYTGDISKINWNDPNYRITPNITVGDVTKGQAARIPQNESDMRTIVNMAYKLEQVQAGWGSDIEFTSWYRPGAVNAAVGGAEHSHHLTGNAVDIQPANGDMAGFTNYMKTNWGQGGIGSYDKWVHFDLGAQRRW